MGRRKKPTEVPLEEAEQNRWLKIIKILHEYLPEDFPEFKAEGENYGLMSELEHSIKLMPDGSILSTPTRSGYEKISIQYRLLSIFLEEFKGNPNTSFNFANLPFKFVAKDFVKQYASKLTRYQMRKILKAFQLRDNTLEDYINKCPVDFKLDDVDQFIADFKTYIQQESPREQYEFAFSGITEFCKISVEELTSLVDDPKINSAGILISSERGLIHYEPRFKAQSILKKST